MSSQNTREGRRRAGVLLAALIALLAVAVVVTRLFPRSRSAGDPREAPAQLQLGMERRAQGDLRGAADAFQRAVALLPDWPAAHLQLGATYYEAREYDLARQELQRAVELAPEEAATWGQLGKLLLTTGQLTDAEKALQRATELQPNRASTLALLGEVYRQRGDRDSVRKSVTLFRQALALHPRDADALHRLGLSYQHLGRRVEAAVALEAATRCAPDKPEPYYALAQVERSRGRTESADAALRTFRRLTQKQRAGEETQTRSPEPDAESSDPLVPRPNAPGPTPRPVGSSPEAGQLIAEGRRVFYEQAQPDRAIELFQQAGRADAASADVPYNLGLVYHFLGRQEEAEAAFRQALALNPRNPRYHAWMGTLALERGPAELDAAIAALRRSVELGPRYAYGHYQLARAYLLQNRPAEAAPLLERTVKLNPRYREAYYSLYQAYSRLGKHKEGRRALATFRRLDAFQRERRRLSIASRSRPDDPVPRVELARLLANNDEREEAIRLLESVVRNHPEHRDARAMLQRLQAPTEISTDR